MAAALLTAAGSCAQAQNLVTNPSFESGAFVNRGDGFQILQVNSTAITGWTVINDSLAWGTTPNSASAVSQIDPFNGAFFLDLQGDGIFSSPYGGVTQAISTVVGQQYAFTFYLGTQEDASSPATHGPITVSAAAGGTSQSFTYNPGGTGTRWGQFGFNFTASNVSTDISIVGTDTAGGAYIGLDLVSVTAVPEPSTVALGAAAAGFLLLARWRRECRRTRIG